MTTYHFFKEGQFCQSIKIKCYTNFNAKWLRTLYFLLFSIWTTIFMATFRLYYNLINMMRPDGYGTLTIFHWNPSDPDILASGRKSIDISWLIVSNLIQVILQMFLCVARLFQQGIFDVLNIFSYFLCLLVWGTIKYKYVTTMSVHMKLSFCLKQFQRLLTSHVNSRVHEI